MSEPKDPERLLADALRAQAVFAPHTVPRPAEGPGSTGPGPAADATGTGSFSASGGPGQPTTGTGSFSASGGPGQPTTGTGSFAAGGTPPAGTGSFGATGTGSFGGPVQASGPAASATGPTTELPPNYGLLSGAGADSLARERAALDAANRTTGSIPPVGTADPTVQRPVPAQQSGPLPAYWVLLLAVLLGLAAGSVIGLITLV
nr:hypothetical protein [Amycolatopsis benzoatilytica]